MPARMSGRNSSPGSRKSSWRDSDRKIAFGAMPMLWKKLVVTIWNPMIGKQRKTMRIPSAASRISSSSVVKTATAQWGSSSPSRNPSEVTQVAPMTVSLSTCIRRSYCRAPKL